MYLVTLEGKLAGSLLCGYVVLVCDPNNPATHEVVDDFA